MTAPALADAVREAEEALGIVDICLCGCGTGECCGAPYYRALRSLLAAVKAQPQAIQPKTHPTIPDGDLGFDAISYAREVVADANHHDADEFSACARETLTAMLAAWDRLRERHDTLSRNHAFLMATKIPPTVVSIPAIPEAVREAAEIADKAMRDVFGGVDQFGDYCGHPMIPAKLAHAVQDLLAALSSSRPPETKQGDSDGK